MREVYHGENHIYVVEDSTPYISLEEELEYREVKKFNI